MQVTERRREIGIMRAVGATQGDVRMIVLGEAALIGLVGGLLGVVLGARHRPPGSTTPRRQYLPRFPFKPDDLVRVQVVDLGGRPGLSTLFCVLGGYLPARRASKMEPAQALAAELG